MQLEYEAAATSESQDANKDSPDGAENEAAAYENMPAALATLT